MQRLRFEHPRGARRRAHQRQGQGLLRGREHPDAGASPRTAWKVNFCKFTNETRNGIEDATANSGQTYIAARERHRRGRRLRARPRLRADRARRRRLVGGVAARGAAARRAARHRRPDPGGRQAARPQGPRRHVRHPSRGRAAARQAVDWRLVDEVVPRSRLGRGGARAGRAPPPPARGRLARRRRASRCPRWTGEVTGDARSRYAHVSARLDRDARPASTITVAGPAGAAARGRGRGCTQLGAAFWPLAVTRELDDLIL